jgi:hypothetical protein
VDEDLFYALKPFFKSGQSLEDNIVCFVFPPQNRSENKSLATLVKKANNIAAHHEKQRDTQGHKQNLFVFFHFSSFFSLQKKNESHQCT